MTLAQVWIDKETFWPLRLLIPMTDSGGGVSILEFRYLLWQKHQKLWYPMKIECYENEQLVREMVVEDMVLNPSTADEDFDISLLTARYGEAAYPEEIPEEVPEQSDIQKAIDDFKKRFE
jgi:outer membrane lipoprotein-sorting protein